MTVICEGGYIAPSYLLMTRQYTYLPLYAANTKNNNNSNCERIAMKMKLNIEKRKKKTLIDRSREWKGARETNVRQYAEGKLQSTKHHQSKQSIQQGKAI